MSRLATVPYFSVNQPNVAYNIGIHICLTTYVPMYTNRIVLIRCRNYNSSHLLVGVRFAIIV